MKVVIAMDSFKGSLTSLEAGNAVRAGILAACPDADVTVLPLADGGEGTIDAIAPYVNGEIRNLTVCGPLGDPVDSYYVFDPVSGTAYIEMAKASGLTLIDESRRDPYNATSYGTGELILDAVNSEANKLVICIGGSATNDGGAGMLQALGARFLDASRNEIPRGAIGLRSLQTVDLSSLVGRDLDIVVASDVSNPLCGPDGCSHVYGPQKGATYEAACEMDEWLKAFAEKCGFDPFEPGTGAAGGMSFALKNFLGATLRSGADIVTDITSAGSLIRECDIVITGEGRMDSQTVNGKAPFKILELGAKYGKHVIGITGILGAGYEACIDAGFYKIVPLLNPTMDTTKAIESVIETTSTLFENYLTED